MQTVAVMFAVAVEENQEPRTSLGGHVAAAAVVVVVAVAEALLPVLRHIETKWIA